MMERSQHGSDCSGSITTIHEDDTKVCTIYVSPHFIILIFLSVSLSLHYLYNCRHAIDLEFLKSVSIPDCANLLRSI